MRAALYSGVALTGEDWTLPDLPMTESRDVYGETLWREGGVRCIVLPSGAGTAVELRSDADGPGAVLTKPCLLPALLAASRLLLRRVLPPIATRPAATPTA